MVLRTALAAALGLLGSVALSDEVSRVRAAMAELEPGESLRVREMTFTMHQKSAGKPDGNGWYTAESIVSGLRVQLPVPFSETSIVGPVADGGTLPTNTVGGRSTEGCRFAAVCFGRTDTRIDMDIGELMKGVSGRSQSAATRDVVQGGLHGRELKIEKPDGGHFVGWFLQGDDWHCQLSVEYPASEADYMPSLAQSFLQSFRAPERSPGEARQHGAAQQEDAPDEGGKEDTQ